jgi:hypothetical protein
MWACAWPGATGAAERAFGGLVVPAATWLGYRVAFERGALRIPLVGLGLLVTLLFLIPLVGTAWGLLLWAAAPLMVVAVGVTSLLRGWRRENRSDRGESNSKKRQMAVAAAVAIYAGYGAGWLALWGYLGV